MTRYALMNSPAQRRGKVHLVEDDEARNSYCGVAVSQAYRYSKRDVTALKGREDCAHCLNINVSRKRKAR